MANAICLSLCCVVAPQGVSALLYANIRGLDPLHKDLGSSSYGL